MKYIHSVCHTGRPLWAAKEGNILILKCSFCGEEIKRYEVVENEDHNPRSKN